MALRDVEDTMNGMNGNHAVAAGSSAGSASEEYSSSGSDHELEIRGAKTGDGDVQATSAHRETVKLPAAADGKAPAPLPSSDLFQSYRTIGVICDSTPVHYKQLGTSRFATVSIGRTWQTYDLDKLRVVMTAASSQTHRINSIVSFKEWTLTTCGAQIYAYKRAQHKHTLSAPDMLAGSSFQLLQLFGSLLLAVAGTEVGTKQMLHIWDLGPTVTPHKSYLVRRRAGKAGTRGETEAAKTK